MTRDIRAREIVWSILLVAVLLGGLLPGGCERRAQAAAAAPPVPEVAAVTIQPQQVVLTTELPGRTSAYLVAEIRPQVNGLIQKRLFTEGSDVKAGEVLYQIDPAPFQAALDNAEAALGRSQASLPVDPVPGRALSRSLLADQAVSQQDYDDAASALKQAEADIQYWKAAVETARINLGYTRVIAPISGRIGRSNVTDGAIVTAYQPVPLATIQQLDPIYVDVPQSTTELLRLKRRLEDGRLNRDGTNQNKVQAHPGRRHDVSAGGDAPIPRCHGGPDDRVRRFCGSSSRIRNGVLLPGMFVRAVVKEGVNEQAILIPQQAVSRDPKGNPVALIVDADGQGRSSGCSRLDRAIGDQWLVSAGLAPGDRVIVEGMQKVRPGAVVKVVRLGLPAEAGGSREDGQPTPQSN